MQDTMLDLAAKDVYDTDIFEANAMFNYESDVRNLQENFNADFNKYQNERRKLEETEKKAFDTISEAPTWQDVEQYLYEKDLKSFESKSYRNKKRINESIKQLFETVDKDTRTKKTKILKSSLSLAERFQQSLREHSTNISELEKRILQLQKKNSAN